MLIKESLIIKALDAALSTGADFAEVFVEESLNNSISMVDGKVDSVGSHLVSGVGIRAYRGLQSASASSSDLSEDAVLSAARSVAAVIGDSSRILPPIRLTERVNTNIHRIEIVPSCVPLADKVELLGRALSSAKAYSPLVSQVTGSLIDVDRKILVANSDGLLTGDRQIRTRMAASAVASRGTESQTGSCSPGRRMGLEMFTSVMTPEEIGTEAARQAVVNIEAGYIDSGVYPVAIENGFGGVIFHESCGHSLEATSVAYGLSEFAGKKGQKIANECVTAIDDGTIPNAWGSLNIDDEGTPTQRKVLIENGILKRYMVDRFNGRRMGEPSSGSARRQSYSFTPTSRMTNTFIAPGEDSDEDIIASIDNGLYCAKMGGGSVNPVTGEFNFAVTEAYLVKDGKIGKAVRGASLIGRGSQILMDIDMVGRDMQTGQGMCGSSSGSIPTDVGQPLIRVSKITVGGR